MNRQELRPILRERFPRERAFLLPALHLVQHELGHLPGWALQTVSWHLRVPASEVYGAATSYSELRLQAPGQHRVRLCAGLACWQAGGQRVLEDLSAQLGIGPGETTADGRVTLETAPCGFLCPLAPAAELDGHWLGRVSAPEMADRVKAL